MPQVAIALLKIGFFVFEAVAGAAAAASLGAGAAVAIGAAVVVGGVLVAKQAMALFEIEMPAVDTDASRQRTVKGTTEPQKIIYGEALVSGPISFIGLSGTNNSDLYQTIILAGHELTDITDIHMDDVVITDSQINGGSDAGGNVTAGIFGPKNSSTICVIKKHLGEASQTADSLLTGTFANYTSAHRGDGIAYLTMKWVLNEDSAETWEKYAPQNVKALVQGKSIYDPRLEFTAVGTRGQDTTNANYIAYSTNPSLCVADYLMDTYLGMSIPASKIDWDAVTTAADGCDATVNVPGGTESRFTCNGVIFATDSHQKNINKILSAMNGNLVYSNGKYIVHAGIYEAPTETLTEDDLTGAISIKTSLERSDRFNTIKGLFIDPAQNHKSSEFPKVQLADAVTRDNNEILEKEVQFPMTNSSYMAQRLAHKLIQLSDQQKIVTFPANLSALRITAGDRVQVSIEELNWSNKVFQCAGWTFSEDGGVNLTLREDSSTSYDDPTVTPTNEYSTVTATGSITDAFRGVPSPSGLTVTPGLKSNELNWVNPGKPDDFGTIYVYASRNANFSSAVKIGETDGTQFVHDASNKSLLFSAGVFNIGDTYTIRDVGTTDFTTIGASANTAGVVFTATGAGSGTGKAWETVVPGNTRYYWVRAVKNVGTDAASRSNLEPNADPNTTVFATVGDVEVDWDNVADPTIGIDLNNDDSISINLGASNSTSGQAVAQSGISEDVTITQGGIRMNQGGSIRGGQTSYNSGEGFFLGYDSNKYKLSIRNSTSEALTFDGDDLTITGAINATSGSIGNSVTVGGTAASTVANDSAAGNQAADQISLLPRADDSEWTVGTGTKGIWSLNGDTSENAVVVETGPHGELERIWKATSTDGSGADGGFQNTSTANQFTIVSDTTYRFSVFIKQDNTNGTIYLGAYNFNQGSTLSLYKYDGTAASTNKYWFSGNLPTQGEWYLLVGFINPSNTNSNSGKGGIYNLATGVKVTAWDDFRFSGDGSETDATTFAVRTYNYYAAATPTSIVRWAHPRVDRLDRRAPSIAELLRGWTSLAEPINAGVTITGGGITMSNGGSIKGGQTAFNTGTGFFLGYDATSPAGYKFSVGNAGNNSLTFEDGALSVSGTVNASSGAFTGDVSTDAKFTAGSNSSTVTLDGTTGANYSIFAGADNSLDASFKVASDGVVEATRFIIRDDANGQVLIDTSNTANPFSGVVYTSISQGSGAGVDTVAGTLANNAGEITITTTQAETFLITAKVAIDDNDGSTNNISGASTVSTTDAENQLKGADLKIEYYLKEGAGAYALEDTEIVTFTEGTPSSSQIKVFGVDRGAGYSGSLTRYFAVIQSGGAAEFVTYFSTSSNANRARTYAVTTASISISGAGTHKIKILARLVDAGTNTTLTNSTTPALVNNNATGTYGGSGIVLDAAQSPPNQSSLDNFKRIYEATSANGFVVSAANTFAIGEGTTILTSGGTISGNLVITGDLTVSGTTTTVDTDNLTVKDNNITLNYSTGDSSSTANNAGITIQDAVSDGVDSSILWRTANDSFDFSHTIRINPPASPWLSQSNIQEILFDSYTSGRTQQNLKLVNHNGNWYDGNSGIDTAWGWMWSFQNNIRAGVHYDTRSVEKFDFYSSYGEIRFRLPASVNGNISPIDSETTMPARLTIKIGGDVAVNTGSLLMGSTEVIDTDRNISAAAVTWSNGGSVNANTAYTYSQVGHLPLAGGTLTGGLSGTTATFSDKIQASQLDLAGTDVYIAYGSAGTAPSNGDYLRLRDVATGNDALQFYMDSSKLFSIDGQSGDTLIKGDLRTNDGGIFAQMNAKYQTENAMAGGGFDDSITNFATALKLFPRTINDSTGNARAVGDYNSGIGFQHLNPNTYGATYTGDQAWIGLRVHDTAGQERDFLVFANNNGTTAGSMPTERMVISPEGYVGIGQPDPSYAVDVSGAIRTSASGNVFNSTYGTATAVTIYSGNTNADAAVLQLARGNGSHKGSGLYISSANYTNGNDTDAAFLRLSGGAYGGSDTNYLKAYDNTSTKFLMRGDGRLGILTDTPSAELDVRGNVRIGDGSSVEQDILFSAGSGNWQVGTNNSGSGATSGNHFYFWSDVYRVSIAKGSNSVTIGSVKHPTWSSPFGGALNIATSSSEFGGSITSTNGNNLRVSTNAYYDGAYKRNEAGRATLYELDQGRHLFYTAESNASADSAISWVATLYLGDVSLDGNNVARLIADTPLQFNSPNWYIKYNNGDLDLGSSDDINLRSAYIRYHSGTTEYARIANTLAWFNTPAAINRQSNITGESKNSTLAVSGGIHSSDFILAPSGTQNILNKNTEDFFTFTGSAASGVGGTPKNVADETDRRTTTSWQSYGYQTADDANEVAWLKVDCKQPYNVTHFAVSGYPGGSHKPSGDWYLQGSNDDSNWTTLGIGDKDQWTAGTQGTYGFKPHQIVAVTENSSGTAYRYFRIYATGWTNGYLLMFNWGLFVGADLVDLYNNDLYYNEEAHFGNTSSSLYSSTSGGGLNIMKVGDGYRLDIARTGDVLTLNNISGAGSIAELYGAGSKKGDIGLDGDLYINSDTGELTVKINGTKEFEFDANQFYSKVDVNNSLGVASNRWNKVYVANEYHNDDNTKYFRLTPGLDGKFEVEMPYRSGRNRFNFRHGNAPVPTSYDTMVVAANDVPCISIVEAISNSTQSTEQQLKLAVGDNNAVISTGSSVSGGLFFNVNRTNSSAGYNPSVGTRVLHMANDGAVTIGPLSSTIPITMNAPVKHVGWSASGGANRDTAIYIGRDGTNTSGEYFTMGWKPTARSGEIMQTGVYATSTAFYIEAGSTEAGGICLDQDSVTVYGSSDGGITFRVVDKDADIVTFQMNQTTWDGVFRSNVIAYGSMSSISDRRIKTDIVPIDPVMDKIKKLGVYSYNKITSPSDKKEVGVIAQELQEQFPLLVGEVDVEKPSDANGLEKILTVDYEHLTAVLLKGLQEQQQQIDELKQTIEDIRDAKDN